MISFIVSDLDGTLLPHGKNSIPEKTLDCISKMQDKGIKFCVASGRSYVELKHLFSSLKKPIYYICSDGALCVYKEKTLFETPIDLNIETKEKAIAYSKYNVFATDSNEPFYRDALMRFNNHVLPLSQAKNQKIFKIALHRAPITTIDGLTKIFKSNEWQEFVSCGVNKGVALSNLQKIIGVSEKDTLILGDAKNDIPMTTLGTSILIGNGFFGSNSHFKYQVPDFLTAIHKYFND